jgi:hypothetical protein
MAEYWDSIRNNPSEVENDQAQWNFTKLRYTAFLILRVKCGIGARFSMSLLARTAYEALPEDFKKSHPLRRSGFSSSSAYILI